jgi:hypothetical protein
VYLKHPSKRGRGKGFNPVGVDTLGPVVRGCLKAIFRNATQRVWCVRVRYAPILTQFPRLLVSVTLQTNLCKPDDGQARPKHVADVTSCGIQLSIVLCKDGLAEKLSLVAKSKSMNRFGLDGCTACCCGS